MRRVALTFAVAGCAATMAACGGGHSSTAEAAPGATLARTACDHWRDYIRQVRQLDSDAGNAITSGISGRHPHPKAAANAFVDSWSAMQRLDDTVLADAVAAAHKAADTNSKYTGLEQDLSEFSEANPVTGHPDPATVNADCATDS